MPQPMHAMLTRQLKRYLGSAAAVPSEWRPLIEAVNKAYREFDQDRGMLERSLDLSSEELIQANADLRESQMRYRTFIDATADLVFLKDESFRHLFINEAYQAFLGKPEPAVIGCTDFDLMPQAAAEHCRASDRQALEMGRCVFAEEALGPNIFQTVKFPVPLPGGRVGVGGYIRDITEHKRAELALRQSEVELRGILDTTADGILAIDSQGKVIKANQRFADIWHIPQASLDSGDDQVLLNSVLDQLSDPEGFLNKVQALYGTTQVDLDLLAFKDGRTIERYSAPLLMEGALIGRVWSFRDITEQQQAERILRDSETRFRTLFETSVDGIMIADVETKRFLYANPSACRLLGYAADELTAMSVADIHPKADLARVVAEFDAQARGEKTLASDIPCLRKDGTIFHADVSTRSILMQGRRCNVGFFRDITGRRQGETALRESEAHNRALIQAIPDLIFTNRRDGEYLSIHASDPRLLISPPESVLHRRIGEVLPHPIAERCLKAIADALDSGAVQELTYSLPLGGQVRHFEARVAPCTQDTVVTFVRDITERKQAEEAMLRHQSYLSAIVENQPGLIWLKDANSRFLAVNMVFAKSCGLDDPALLIGKSDLDIWPRELALQYIANDAEVMKSGKNFMVEELISVKDVLKWFETFKTPIFDKQGQAIGTTGYSRDITERKQAEADKAKLEADLHQAQRMESIGRLAGGVAHDFNNMLTVILGRAEMAIEQVDPTYPIHGDLEEIRKAASRSANLTRQLLAFARKQTIALQILDLNETVAGMIQMLKRLIGENIELAWHPGANLGPVRVDPSQIDQILANLCVNARAAIAGIGQITIQTRNVVFDKASCVNRGDILPGEFVLLSVSDNGCGMDRETLSHIFEPFFTTKGVGEGTGLGLATIYGIVKQNNGFVTVDSAPNQGSTFKIYLPRHAGKPDHMKPVLETQAMRGNETILLVEDEPAILDMTTKVLERQGYTVLAANTPGQAIQLAREHPGTIHLLMTDVVMPEMNGQELAQKLQSLYPQIHSLFMSGYTADVIAHNGMLDDDVYFIQKPFAQQELAAKVRQIFDVGGD